SQELAALRTRLLGKKSGALTALFASMASAAPSDKPQAGALLNPARARVEERLTSAAGKILQRGHENPLRRERGDVTRPGRRPSRGALHPTTQTRRRIEAVFREMGYSVATGPEVETDFNNFEALNMPPDHPARDAHDTFYIEGGLLLRTHTSPVQI